MRDRYPDPWPPAEEDIRLVADVTISGLEGSGQLPVWATAAMLVSFQPLLPWQAHLEAIWQIEDDDGVNITALHALETRARRQRFRPATPDPE